MEPIDLLDRAGIRVVRKMLYTKAVGQVDLLGVECGGCTGCVADRNYDLCHELRDCSRQGVHGFALIYIHNTHEVVEEFIHRKVLERLDGTSS